MKRIFSHATVFICFLFFNINIIAQPHAVNFYDPEGLFIQNNGDLTLNISKHQRDDSNGNSQQGIMVKISNAQTPIFYIRSDFNQPNRYFFETNKAMVIEFTGEHELDFNALGVILEFTRDKVTFISKTNFGAIEGVIDSAEDGDIIQFNPEKEIAFPRALHIKKGITIRGLNGRQKDADDLDDPVEEDKYSLLIIESEGVTIENFVLTGYYDADREDRLIKEKYQGKEKNNPYEKHKHALINVSAGGFTIKNGKLNNSLKDGIMINPNPEISKNISSGYIENITGSYNHKDVISIGGNGANGLVKNLVVEHITCRHSKDKGAVEVSDGTRNTKVRNVEAYFSPYAIDIQDHYDSDEKDDEKKKEKKMGTNRTVTIVDVLASNCEYGIKTANHDLKSKNNSKGHSNLSIDSLTAIRCAFPIQISNTEGVKIRNVCIEDGKPEAGAPYVFDSKNPRISLKNCQDEIILENINIKDANNQYTGKDLKVNKCTDSKKLKKTKITHNLVSCKT